MQRSTHMYATTVAADTTTSALHDYGNGGKSAREYQWNEGLDEQEETSTLPADKLRSAYGET